MYLIHHLVQSSETYTSSKTKTLNHGEKENTEGHGEKHH